MGNGKRQDSRRHVYTAIMQKQDCSVTLLCQDKNVASPGCSLWQPLPPMPVENLVGLENDNPH